MSETMGYDLQDKSAHISSLNKTPASIVQEYAAKKGLVPQYNIIYNGISQSKVSFKYSLLLDGYETVGEGSSKKEAKHVAALKLLKNMIDDKPELLDTEFKEWDFENHVVSPFDHNIKVNAVGQLNDICSNNKLGLPEFTLVREEGQAHAKLFTISCLVANVVEIATHKTKKQAKHLAAVQMVNKLMAIDIDKSQVLEMEAHNQPNSSEVLEQVAIIKSEVVKKNAPMDKHVSIYHLLFKKNEWECCDTLKQVVKQFIQDGNILKLENPCKTLLDIVNECGMSMSDRLIKGEILSKNTYVHIYTIDNVYPPINAIGSNDINDDMAKYEAAINLLDMLCFLYK